MNNQQPDRARPNDLDGLGDVPTYESKQQSSRLGKLYERYGRSEPKNVEPKNIESQNSQLQHGDSRPADDLYKVSSEPEPTTAFEAPSRGDAISDRARQSVAQPHPEPYSQPQQMYTPPAYVPQGANTDVAPAVVAEPTPATAAQPYEPVDTPATDRAVDARRGTIDLGLMIFRVALGALLLLQGLRTFFGLGGSEGLNGLRDQFSSYSMSEILTLAVPTMQLVAGVFLLLGLLTPVAAAIATAVTGFGAVHAVAQSDGLNLLNPPESLVLPILLAVLALGLQFTGPGKVSLDFGRSWAHRPLVSSWLWAIVGIAGAVAMWWFLAGVNPLN